MCSPTRLTLALRVFAATTALVAIPPARAQELLVVDHNSQYVGTFGAIRYDASSGTGLGSFAGQYPDRAYGLAIAANGDALVSYFDSGLIRRYDSVSGALLDTFNPGAGTLRDIDFGPDGLLYVIGSQSIVRYDSDTDTGLTVLNSSVPTVANLQQMDFGPDGNIYVAACTFDTSTAGVYKFDRATGAFLGVFVAAGSGGLGDLPSGLAFSPSGVLVVGDERTGLVLRYDAITGAFIDSIAYGLVDPRALAFGPDGNLYVAAIANGDSVHSILRYNGVTGAFIDTFVSAGNGGLNTPDDLEFTHSASAPPLSISITSPTATTYLINQVVQAVYSCTGGSGTATCSGPVPSGSNIDTATAGTKTFNVTANDSAGNAATQSVSYNVAYAVEALYDQTKAHKSGSTYPIKLQLTDAAGANLSSSSITVHATSTTQLSGTPTGLLDDSGNANPNYDFRYDSTLGGYIFNLSLKGYAPGIYAIHFISGSDPTDHVLQFQVK